MSATLFKDFFPCSRAFLVVDSALDRIEMLLLRRRSRREYLTHRCCFAFWWTYLCQAVSSPPHFPNELTVYRLPRIDSSVPSVVPRTHTMGPAKDHKHLIAGSLSGLTVRFLTQPLDVLKIRFQLQIEPIRHTHRSYYSGMVQAVIRIIREEGVTALWKGHVPGQLLSVSFAGVEFAVFYGLNKFLAQHILYSAHRDVVCGIAAGTAATVVCQPLDVMRTRLVAQGQKKIYSGLLRGCASLVRDEGVWALWRGLGPACLLMAPQTAVTFAVYEKLKRTYQATQQPQESVARPHSESAKNASGPNTWNLLFGCASGLVAKTSVYPLDLVKKRLAVRGFEEARKPFGQLPTAYTAASYARSQWRPSRWQFLAVWSCLRDIVKVEGLRGLFKGWTPSAFKAGLSTGLTFYFFEFYLQLL